MLKIVVFGLLLMAFSGCSLNIYIPVDDSTESGSIVEEEKDSRHHDDDEQDPEAVEEVVIENQTISADAIRTAFMVYRPEYADYYSDVSLNESINIQKVEGDYAYGGMTAAWWYAKRVDGVWAIAAAGNGDPSCESLEGFPESFNIVCW